MVQIWFQMFILQTVQVMLQSLILGLRDFFKSHLQYEPLMMERRSKIYIPEYTARDIYLQTRLDTTVS